MLAESGINWTMYHTVIFMFCAVTSAHEITKLLVPLTADPRRAAELSCHFRMYDQRLHSVKWYRDMDEIFRYNPTQKPQIRLFNVNGITVKDGFCEEEVCIVRVMPPPVSSSAAYTCEVSTEGPKFQIARASKQMTVISLPEHDPVISDAPSVVKPGEHILANCTSDYSLPHSDIRWYIDDQLQMPESWQRTELSATLPGGLRASWRVLRAEVPQNASGALRLRCEAKLLTVPPVVRETTAIVTIHSQTQISKFVSNRGTNHRLSVLYFLIVVTSTVISSCFNKLNKILLMKIYKN